MKYLIILICILIIVTSCELNSSMKSSADRGKPTAITSQSKENATDTITVFLTGNTLGSLKPCGCSGGQLGGLERRPAIFNTVPEDKRLIIDTGSFVEDYLNRQDQIKFTIIIESLDYLDYDIVNLTKQDLELGMHDNPSIGFISSYETDESVAAGYQSQYFLDGEYINIAVIAFDPLEQPIEDISKMFPNEPGQKNVNILILNNYSEEIIDDISRIGIVDCMICPVQSDEPTTIGNPDVKPLVCSVGRYGRYVSKVNIQKTRDDDLKLSFDYIAVREEISRDETLIGYYERYQDIVKLSNLLENNPRFVLEDGLKYIGSEACSSEHCHAEEQNHQFEYIVWSDNPDPNSHAHAYQTLVEVGSQYDPECIVCHVVGYEYESGYVSEEKTPHLKNVGCEVCHGPGSAHYENPYDNKTRPIEDIRALCQECHTPEHDGDFAGHEQEKFEIIYHGQEPNAPSIVK